MKKKELKKIAWAIAEAEKVLATQEASQEDKRMARETILALFNRIDNVDDMLFIDDYVQEYLQKI